MPARRMRPGMGVPQPRPAPVTEISLEYPGTSAQAAGNVASLWKADLADQNVLARGRIDPGAWNDASLRWLVDPVSPPEADLPGGFRVGLGDVERFRVTVETFRQLDNRFGGGHARSALIQYLSGDGDRLLRGRYTGTVGSALFTSVAEATLLAGFLSALAVFGGTRVAIGLRCWEADPFHKFRNKRQQGRGSPAAQAAGPLADRWRLSRHRN
jgi:hypothetical protein